MLGRVRPGAYLMALLRMEVFSVPPLIPRPYSNTGIIVLLQVRHSCVSHPTCSRLQSPGHTFSDVIILLPSVTKPTKVGQGAGRGPILCLADLHGRPDWLVQLAFDADSK